MSILTLNNIGHSYGDFDVFSGINATIPNDGKVGLVGPNGIGKTTLLRILIGGEESTAGKVITSRETRIGYLQQQALDAFSDQQHGVHEEMLTVFAEVRGQEAEIAMLQEQMATEYSEALMTKYSAASEAFEMGGGYDYEVRIATVLDGLGFARDDWHTPIHHLSGGQKTRALLARLLLEEPDLLILDEPTNHLDVDAIQWLEGALRTWDGALLIVSHDRYFLDKVVTHIWEMSRLGIEEYRGNYSAYTVQRHERWERRSAEFEAIREKFFKELDYVKRNIARDSTTNMAKGRLKRLIREVRVVEQGGLQALQSKTWSKVMDEIEISGAKWNVADVESAIKSLNNPIVRPPELKMNLDSKVRSGETVLRTTEMDIGYEDKTLFTTEPITLQRQEVAALIGPNGTGKTTFLRTLMSTIEPRSGKMTPGHNLRIGYFAQAHDGLNHENTVLDELIEHKHMLLGPARNHLARYLFRGDDVYKPIHMLSGGERGRLALAILALEGANFLLLDEPTNHLDIPAQEVLQSVLEAFDGTILMVSHDRYLIDKLATQIWSLDHGVMHVYEGTYARYLNRDTKEISPVVQKKVERKNENRGQQQDERKQRNEERKRARKIEELEANIVKLEEKLVQVSDDLQVASDAQDLNEITRLGELYAQVQSEVEGAMEAWTAAAAA